MTEPRKRGAKKLPTRLKKVGGSIALTPAQWRKLDKLRGKTPRGTFIAEQILGKAPVAWLHIMDSTEGIPENEPWRMLSFEPEHPFGIPGVNYSAEFPVKSVPLYAILNKPTN